jgi:thiamine biosynthesis protein ThiS
VNDNLPVIINGEGRQVPAGLNVVGLLGHLGLPLERVAIERNMEILSRTDWDKTTVAAGDRFEIVHLVGGG